jgi:hypothetical protein
MVSGGTVSATPGEAIYADGEDSAVTVTGGTVKSTSTKGYAIQTLGARSVVTAEGGVVKSENGTAIWVGKIDGVIDAGRKVVVKGNAQVTATKTGDALTSMAIAADCPVEVSGHAVVSSMGIGISTNHNVSVSGNASVSADANYNARAINVESYRFGDGHRSEVTIDGGTVTASGHSSRAISANGEVVVLDVDNVNEVITFGDAIGPLVTVKSGEVTAEGDWSRAIEIGNRGAGGPAAKAAGVTIEGGTVRAAGMTSSAVSVVAAPKDKPDHAKVTVTGGIVYAHSAAAISVDPANTAGYTGATGTGVVIGWNKNSAAAYTAGTMTDLTLSPGTGAAAYWDRVANVTNPVKNGISYKNGVNAGFLEEQVTVNPGAIIGNVTISGTQNENLQSQTAVITLFGGAAVGSAITAGADVSSWFNNSSLPAGITATAAAVAGSETITLTFGGKPTGDGAAAFNITIPAANVTGNSSQPLNVAPNPGAKFTIFPKEATPKAGIDYAKETLTNLVTGTYSFNGAPAVSVSGTTRAIETAWLGNEITIVKKGDETTSIDSDAQNLPIPARPMAPKVSGVNETVAGKGDGSISGVTAAMEYKRASASVWKDCTGTSVTGLGAGAYEVRVKATSSAFCSEPVSVTISADSTGSASVTQTYALTVTGGSGSGSYEAGAKVNIVADELSGKVFDRWTGGGGGAFANAGSAATTFTMPAEDVTVTAAHKNAPVLSGWVYGGGRWYFYDNGGDLVTGWLYYERNWYLLDYTDGHMLTGWAYDNGAWYYLGGSGAMKTGWLKAKSAWYYLGGNGAMKTSWAKIGGVWYYLAGNGTMRTGWVHNKGIWYYLRENGAMAQGSWVKYRDNWYYLRPVSGSMPQSTWLRYGNDLYYLKPDGRMAFSETRIIGGRLRSFDRDGRLRTAGLVAITSATARR